MSISLLATIFNFISFLVTVYYFGMIIYFFTSWVPNIRESVVGRFLSSIYEPYLEPFRKIIPPLGMIDISSLVALFVLILFQWGLDSIFRAILIYVAAH
ncbi:YggT family protein [Staphylococcus lugdunensis]|uniref:YggT family protein n=1 Tax=Staphylococcus TaxID=1279 RepID=UPI0008A45328|nr:MULTISPECIES: YggT family protein [Staphylococcus]ARJ14251.1 YggT family protein [Staphylococcus lugdunensis]MCH8666213.1 YggT family protein [Staphylococcus lugdunensis]OFJ64766.1 cell division protein [Staphylococcus sp. HMSC077E11]OFM48482.1 cell division protein [Staphylococcus sp. HMSC077E12]OFR89745.1 cell division protein [Staphylococcus sp. HMSC059F04]